MSGSRFGRPDLDMVLDESSRGGRKSSGGWSSCDNEGLNDDEEPNYPDDGGLLELSNKDNPFNNTTTMSDNCNLFVPELVYNLDQEDDRPGMPDLPLDKFPLGTPVWVVDIEHVRMQLGDAWDHSVRNVCNGQVKGTIIRHITPQLLFVKFIKEEEGLEYCYTLPRRCLSTTPIDPYPLPVEEPKEGAVSFGVGGLQPRAGRAKEKRKEDVNVLQQYCEVVDAGTPSQRTEAAWNLFLKRKFKDSIVELDNLFANAKEDDLTLKNEILTWRSFAHFFNKEYDKSLADALRTIENNTSWVKGYVRAARAYTGLGKLQRALEMMNQASLLLPHSKEVVSTLSMLQYLKKNQARVEVHGLQYSLDPNYAKRLLSKRTFDTGDVILNDDAIVIGCPSLENTGSCCEVCMYPTDAPVVTNSTGHSYRLCNSRCESISRNFLSIESEIGSRGCDYAIQLMLNKASKSADLLTIERARLAMRLFYVAYYRHKRQTGGSAKEVLATYGVFPIPSCELDSKTKDDLESLHAVITNFMTDEEKNIYNKELLVLAFNYVVNYALHITGSDADGKRISGYLIASIASCVERWDSDAASPTTSGSSSPRNIVNCEVKLVGPGTVAVIAERNINPGDRLTIAALRKGRITE